MAVSILELAVWLLTILAGCELFSNGIEWAGKKMKLGEGAVGSVLAAVGTALPETMVPIMALLFGRGEKSIEVGVGAIAGAPFMLSTLAFMITGVAVLVYAGMGRRTREMRADAEVIGRDIRYFLIVYFIAVVVVTLDTHDQPWTHVLRYLTAAFLLGAYGYYVYRTFRNPGEHGGDIKELHLARLFRLDMHSRHIAVQVLIGLGLIILGAHEFVRVVEHVSELIGVSALVLSLIITPIATELPEKMNSVLWTRNWKDTLALGNITGAMVFQSCIPVALGVALVHTWHLHDEAVASAILALASAGVTYLVLKVRKRFSPWALLSGGVFYALFMIYVFAIPH